MKKYFAIMAIAAFVAGLPLGMAMAQQTGQYGTSGMSQQGSQYGAQSGYAGQSSMSMGSAAAVQPPSSWGMDAFKGSKIIGARVNDNAGNKIGSIHDLFVDTNTGRVPFAVIDHNGKYSAVPINLFRMGSKDHDLVLNMDKNQVAQLPTFEKNNWPNPTDRTWSSSVYRYFAMRPYWEESSNVR